MLGPLLKDATRLQAEAINNKYDNWQDNAHECLALIILLDKFSRNLFRNNKKAFTMDKKTRQIATKAINQGYHEKLILGNLDSKRDWGYAKDFVEAMWLMLQQNNPDDFVIATGKSYSVREFVEIAAKELEFDLVWDGKGINEINIHHRTTK